MKYLLLFGLFALLLAGCTETSVVTPGTPQPGPAEPTCRIVSEDVPMVEVVCDDVSVTEQVCGIRKLNYTVVEKSKIDLCIGSSQCIGKPLSDCPTCNKAMSRCIMTITNNEPVKSGSWTVGANFTLPNAAFIKDPKTYTLGPGESFDFDFEQIYSPGYPINSAICKLFVVSVPSFEDCHDETRMENVCENVTTLKTVEKEVCS